MLLNDRERVRAADLLGDFPPGSLADRFAGAASASERIELFAQKNRDGRLGHRLDLRFPQNPLHAAPFFRFLAVW